MLSLSHSRPARIVPAFLAAVAVSFGAAAAPAVAAPAPNESVINVDPLVTAALQVAKVKVTPTGAAKQGSAGLYYPVVNARSMSDGFVGTLKHQGGFELKIGTLKVGFRNFVIKTKNRKPVGGVLDATPVVNGIAMPFTVPFSEVTLSSVVKKGTTVTAKYRLSINPEIAKLINETLKVKLFNPGDAWANVETRWLTDAAEAKK